jgi:alkyl sulfatase BDS1-like metallo-beta-lactamase superfamily hydrolase
MSLAMTALLDLSARIIDSGDITTRTNRVTTELSEVADDVAVVEAFSHVWAVRTSAGLVLFDTSAAPFGAACRDALRRWAPDPVDTIVYTHGHVDHVGGANAWIEEAAAEGHPSPNVVAHEAVPRRFDRYDLTNGYNGVINQRQFNLPSPQFFSDWVHPTHTYEERMSLTIGEEAIELRHGRGETDDHTWAWLPERRTIFAGDFLIWNFPNAGNPQKVQRYPSEWAEALREMASAGAELFCPAHGLPIGGADRISMVLTTTADALDDLVTRTLALMNEGARLDQIVQEVEVDEETLLKPWLRPMYDEPEFIVRNIWRLYGGWWDMNPATLKPAPESAVATEIAALSGGAVRLAQRGREIAESGDLRLACHLVEMAALADPDDVEVHRARAEVYQRRRSEELSLMSKGIYGAAARESADKAGIEIPKGKPLLLE